jgi:hypothetical protein
LQVAPEAGGGVESAFLEDVGDVAAGEDDYGVAVFADLLVGLVIEVGGVTRTPNWRCRSREISRLVSRTPTPLAGP